MSDFIPFTYRPQFSDAERASAASAFNALMQQRRTVRDFTDQAVPRTVIEACIRAAASAPSGAHRQPWHFVAVSDPTIKQQIRVGAEAEEREFYQKRAPQEWLDALKPLGTDEHKPFLQTAPWLIAVFAERYGLDAQGQRLKHYYTGESVGIACGLLLAALHACGLATLTHTPSPMGFLKTVLKRPDNERPYLLIVTGHASAQATVPNIRRKDDDQIMTFFSGDAG